jgi:hypothetical protein
MFDQHSQYIKEADTAWIFQWIADDYNTFEDFHSGKRTEPWRANQHFKKMKVGDIALLWKSESEAQGQVGEAGIYGVGRLVGDPYTTPLDPVAKNRVKLEYLFLLVSPIPKTNLLDNPDLDKLGRRVTQGSNFRVEETWIDIKEYLLNQIALYSKYKSGKVPDKRRVEGLQFIRDSKIVRQIKKLVQHRCQICGNYIRTKNGKLYSEGHHIKPLGKGHNGTDEEGYIVILCPNHHVEFDLGVIAIEPTSLSIVHWDKSNPFHSKNLAYTRNLKNEFLEYHYTKIFID